jgi:hypothetical protein
LVKQPLGIHRLCQEVYRAYHPRIEYITEPIVTAEGATNHVELDQLDASQGPVVPVVNEFSDVLLEEMPDMPLDRDIKFVIE